MFYLLILVNFEINLINFLYKISLSKLNYTGIQRIKRNSIDDKWHWWNWSWETELPNARGYKFDEHVCSRRAKSTRNWSFLTPGCRAIGALVFHVSLHWEHRFRRVAAPTLLAKRRFARMHVAAAFFFSPPRRVGSRVASSLKSMQIFHETLFAVRAFVNHREKKHPSGQPLFPPSSSRRGLFSFCRRCPTWRYVKRIYNWRYDGRALESNTSILIPATYAAHPSHPAYTPLSLSATPRMSKRTLVDRLLPCGYWIYTAQSRDLVGNMRAGMNKSKFFLIESTIAIADSIQSWQFCILQHVYESFSVR